MGVEPTTAALIVKIAYLASGLVLCFLGKGMLEKGIVADFIGEGEVASRKLRIVTSSPGIVFLLAGLTALVIGIRHETSVVSEHGEVRLGRATPDVSGSIDPLILVNRVRELNRTSPREDVERAQGYYDQAGRCEQRDANAQCVELLLKATALDPNLFTAVIDSPLLGKRLQDPVFRTFAVARLQIYLRQEVSSATLSKSASGMLARIEILALQSPASQPSSNVTATARARLDAGTINSALIDSLVALLESDPGSLHGLLSEPGNAWALEEDDVQIALSQGLNRVNISLFSPDQE